MGLPFETPGGFRTTTPLRTPTRYGDDLSAPDYDGYQPATSQDAARTTTTDFDAATRRAGRRAAAGPGQPGRRAAGQRDLPGRAALTSTAHRAAQCRAAAARRRAPARPARRPGATELSSSEGASRASRAGSQPARGHLGVVAAAGSAPGDARLPGRPVAHREHGHPGRLPRDLGSQAQALRGRRGPRHRAQPQPAAARPAAAGGTSPARRSSQEPTVRDSGSTGSPVPRRSRRRTRAGCPPPSRRTPRWRRPRRPPRSARARAAASPADRRVAGREHLAHVAVAPRGPRHPWPRAPAAADAGRPRPRRARLRGTAEGRHAEQDPAARVTPGAAPRGCRRRRSRGGPPRRRRPWSGGRPAARRPRSGSAARRGSPRW